MIVAEAGCRLCFVYRRRPRLGEGLLPVLAGARFRVRFEPLLRFSSGCNGGWWFSLRWRFASANCECVSLFCADRLPEVAYVAEERAVREMATKIHPVSTLNPNAPLFVPAAYRVVEDFSSEWWNLVQTCPDFREQWVRERLPALEEQEMFEADLDEIADLDEFLEYQDELQEVEAAQDSFHFDADDGLVQDDLSLFNINQIRDLKLNPKPQAPWCKPLKHHDRIPYKVPNSTKKGATYRIQQPRAVM